MAVQKEVILHTCDLRTPGLRQEDCLEFKDILGYIVGPHHETKSEVCHSHR